MPCTGQIQARVVSSSFARNGRCRLLYLNSGADYSWCPHFAVYTLNRGYQLQLLPLQSISRCRDWLSQCSCTTSRLSLAIICPVPLLHLSMVIQLTRITHGFLLESNDRFSPEDRHFLIQVGPNAYGLYIFRQNVLSLIWFLADDLIRSARTC